MISDYKVQAYSCDRCLKEGDPVMVRKWQTLPLPQGWVVKEETGVFGSDHYAPVETRVKHLCPDCVEAES